MGIALTIFSSLKQAKSSAEPPPRPKMITSALPSISTRAIARRSQQQRILPALLSATATPANPDIFGLESLNVSPSSAGIGCHHGHKLRVCRNRALSGGIEETLSIQARSQLLQPQSLQSFPTGSDCTTVNWYSPRFL